MRKMIGISKALGMETLACCCGHGIYKKTIVARFPDKEPYEFFTKIKIPRKKKFYKRDSNGVFYIPEVEVVINE
jgi:hypothetical protein